MIAAIAGDIIGSVYERDSPKTTDFPLFHPLATFTDDTVHTLAIAEAIQSGLPYDLCLRQWSRDFPDRGYGGMMQEWIANGSMGPYNSFGNGSAMRVAPVGYAFNDLETVLLEAERSAIVTHNHPEGVKGAKAIAGCVFLARTGHSKAEISSWVEEQLGYTLPTDLDALRQVYTFDVTCQGSVPESIACFLASEDVESAIRLAVSLGGDTDTMACMAGVIAGAFYQYIPSDILIEVEARLGEDLWEFVVDWCTKFGVRF